MEKIESLRGHARKLREWADSDHSMDREPYAMTVEYYREIAENCEAARQLCMSIIEKAEERKQKFAEKRMPKMLKQKTTDWKTLYRNAVRDWGRVLYGLISVNCPDFLDGQSEYMSFTASLAEWFRIRIRENCGKKKSNFRVSCKNFWKLISALTISYGCLRELDIANNDPPGTRYFKEFKEWECDMQTNVHAKDWYALPYTANRIYTDGAKKYLSDPERPMEAQLIRKLLDAGLSELCDETTYAGYSFPKDYYLILFK